MIFFDRVNELLVYVGQSLPPAAITISFVIAGLYTLISHFFNNINKE